MRRATKLSLVTIAALLAFETLVRLASPVLPEPLEWYSGFAQRKAELISAADFDVDVIFLGDSTTMSALDPHRFDEELTCVEGAFNAAIPAATPTMMVDWWDRVVAKAWSPDFLLIGLTSRTLVAGPVDEYSESLAVREDLGASLTKSVSQFSYAVRYRSVLRDAERIVAHFQVAPGWEQLDTRGWGGGREGDYLSETGPQTRAGELHAGEMKALESFVARLEEQGVTSVILWMPTTGDWVDNFEDEETVDNHRDEVKALALSSSAGFVDLSHIDSKELFVDPLHLNVSGAEQVLEDLLTQLEGAPCA